jgi:hypothetical protein
MQDLKQAYDEVRNPNSAIEDFETLRGELVDLYKLFTDFSVKRYDKSFKRFFKHSRSEEDKTRGFIDFVSHDSLKKIENITQIIKKYKGV